MRDVTLSLVYIGRMDPSAISDDLWAYRAKLIAQMRETDAELQRVNGALRALHGGEMRTFDLLRACFADEYQVDARRAMDYLTARGWQAEARGNALNAVRTALAHMAEYGEIERVSRGIYRAVASTEREERRSA